jgi:hypothetical protein
VDRSNPDLKALAVGLGAFGVIARVVLDMQPTYLVRQDVYRNAPWDTALDAFDAVMASAYSSPSRMGEPRRPHWSRNRAVVNRSRWLNAQDSRSRSANPIVPEPCPQPTGTSGRALSSDEVGSGVKRGVQPYPVWRCREGL